MLLPFPCTNVLLAACANCTAAFTAVPALAYNVASAVAGVPLKVTVAEVVLGGQLTSLTSNDCQSEALPAALISLRRTWPKSTS
ncbi:hypothetical protein D3C80_1612850 [compost metagenome]